MKISVIGSGYVGLTLSCLADYGHSVNFVEKDREKVELIHRGESPIYEPGLAEILGRNITNGRITIATDYAGIDESEIVFICVGTPSRGDGSIDVSQVVEASEKIAERLKTSDYKVVCVKSTVVPGTTRKVIIPLLEKTSGKKVGRNFGVCVNPEFLREGTGVNDFLNPDKIVIGGIDERSVSKVANIYEKFDNKVYRFLTDLTTAEMIKYAQNSALASRISFINEVANICEKFNVDVKDIMKAIGLDERIGPKFLNAGIGFGGSCFPKDVKALIAVAKEAGLDPIFLKSILDINDRQPYRLVELGKETIGDLNGKTVAVLGVSFKPDTDDIRESRAVIIINELLKQGAKVKVYDPKAMERAKVIFKNQIQYCSSKEECLEGADLCMIATEWNEFRELDLPKVNCPIIDGRRALDPQKAKQHGLIYKGIGYKWNFGE